MQLSVCLAQGPENLWQFKLLKWIFICIHHHVFTFMAGPAASVSCPKMEQRCQQCWLLDAHFEGRRTKRRVNWLTFDNRSCLCEYANHARPPNTHEHTPALEQSRTTWACVGNSSKCDANNLIVSQSWLNPSTLHQWREVSQRCLNLAWSHW